MPTFKRARITDGRITDSKISDYTERASIDSALGIDSLNIQVSLAVSDSATGSDSISRIDAAISISDSASGSEETISITTFIPISNSGTGSDSVSITNSFSLEDSATGSDSLFIEANVSVSDSGTGVTEILGIAKNVTVLSLARLKQGRITESRIADATDIFFTVSDSSSGSESIEITRFINVSDSAVGSDATSITIQISVADSGVGSEAILIDLQITVTDSATGSETAAFVKAEVIDLARVTQSRVSLTRISEHRDLFISITDIAAGSEILNFNKDINAADSALGNDVVGIGKTLIIDDRTREKTPGARATASKVTNTRIVEVIIEPDLISIEARIPISDSATGADSVLVSIGISISDVATGSDVVSAVARFIVISDTGYTYDEILATGVRIHQPSGVPWRTWFSIYLEEDDGEVD